MLRDSRLISICRSVFFLAAVFLFVTKFQATARAGGACGSYCSASVDCSDTCLDDYDQDSTCGAYGVCAPDCSDVCGSGSSCTTPCSGGDGEDCGAYNGGVSNGECYGYCGDGACDTNFENCNSCSADCGPPGSCTASCSVTCNTPGSNECGSGLICDTAKCCVLNETGCSTTGYCSTNSDCCDGYMCYGPAPGYAKMCAFPKT